MLLVTVCLLISMAAGYAVYHHNFNLYLDTVGAEAESVFAISNSYVSLYSQLREQSEQTNLPVPFTYRAMVTESFNAEKNSPEHFEALMVGMPDSYIETPPTDEHMGNVLQSLQAAPGSNYSGVIDLRGSATLRTMYPAIADEQTCVDCHNTQVGQDAPFKLGDMLGAYVIDREVQNFKSRHINYGWFTALLTFIALTAGYVVWVQNRTLKLQARQLTAMAESDSLTGCLNHRGLRQREMTLLDRAARNTAVLSIDIDHFKRINDAFGHEIGDEVLTRFAHTVRGELGENDVFSRIGGGEFLVYLVQVDEGLAREIAARICRKVTGIKMSPGGTEINLTVSIGGMHIAQNLSGSFRSFNKIVDASLYKAKRQGRNQVVWFDYAANNDARDLAAAELIYS